MLVDASSFAEVGMFDEATFLENEEPILAEKFAARSKFFYYLPGVTVIHYHGRSGGSDEAIKSLAYYFRTYRQASGFSIAALRLCAGIYRVVYEPLKRILRY